MCCNHTVIYYYNYCSASADMASKYEGKSTSDLSKSRKVKGHLANRQTKIRMTSRGIQLPTAVSWLSLTTVMDVSQLYTAYVTTCGHNKLCRVVKRKSCETYWILLERLMSYDGACVVWGRSPVDIDSHKLSKVSSWKVVHHCEHVNTHWWTSILSAAHFMTINVDWTVTSNDTRVVISRHSRIQ